MEALQTPVAFGSYFLHAKVGQGGMAEVFLATSSRDALQGRPLALKKLHPHLSNNKPFVNLLIHEAKVGVLLTHPNIATVYDLGNYKSEFFISIEYVHGKSLEDLLKLLPLPTPLAHYIVLETIRGLAFAHDLKDSKGRELNIVHRDLSPGNILLSYNGDIKITDFGIATAEHRLQPIVPQHALGKVAFMPPEQALNDPAIRASDLYSLGLVYFMLLTGRHPYQIRSTDDLFRLPSDPGEIASGLSELAPQIPIPLIEFIASCISKSSQQRPQSAAEFFHKLRGIIQEIEGEDFFLQSVRAKLRTKLAKFLSQKLKKEIKQDQALIETALEFRASEVPQKPLMVDYSDSLADATVVDADIRNHATMVSHDSLKMRVHDKLLFSSLARDQKESLQLIRPQIEIVSEEEQSEFEQKTLLSHLNSGPKSDSLARTSDLITKPGVTKQSAPRHDPFRKDTLILSTPPVTTPTVTRIKLMTWKASKTLFIPLLAFTIALTVWLYLFKSPPASFESFYPLVPRQDIQVVTWADSRIENASQFLHSLQKDVGPGARIEDFFNREYQRYVRLRGAPLLHLSWKAAETLSIVSDPLIAGPHFDESRWKDKLQGLLKKNGPRHPEIVLLLLSPSTHCPPVALKLNSHIVVASDGRDVERTKILVSQGIGLLYGATLKNISGTSAPQHPFGLGRPYAQPIYPQEEADLMSGFIALNAEKTEPAKNFSELLINEFTARELGWIP